MFNHLIIAGQKVLYGFGFGLGMGLSFKLLSNDKQKSIKTN
jgi:hypothetical protein